MVDDSQIREHMMVHSSAGGEMNSVGGQHVGTVDCIENGMMILKLNDSLDGKHQMIPTSWVESVEGETVHLSKRFDDVMKDWSSES